MKTIKLNFTQSDLEYMKQGIGANSEQVVFTWTSCTEEGEEITVNVTVGEF